MQARCERERIARQQESSERCEHRLQVRRESAYARRQSERVQQRQQQHDVSRQSRIIMEKFKADLQTSLDYCSVCNSLMFADKVKSIHGHVLSEVSQLNNVQMAMHVLQVQILTW